MGTATLFAGTVARRNRARRKWYLSPLVVLGLVSGLSGDALAREGWMEIDYSAIVDGRRLSHSGESVEALLGSLGGRPMPPPGQRPADALAYRLLDPWLEPYAFVLSDALDSLGTAPDPPMVEVGYLFAPGAAQPAWAELLRSRRFVVESDGAGRMRVCAPSSGGDPAAPPPSVEAGREAFERAWPVLRHVFATERRRLQSVAGESVELPTLEVEVHPYVHRLARTEFVLGVEPYRVEVADTRSDGRKPPLDLAAWNKFLGSGLSLEGARLVEGGALRFLGSEASEAPTLLGRPVELSDFAVAYRAAARGGRGEPYMSLDRSYWPQDSLVNYGGRLRDTSLGLISLLCDIRFKTFSLGIDPVEAADVRDRVRAAHPEFETHLERFAAHPSSAQVSAQQTRLWFYPDAVDLTLSNEGDILVVGSPRMSAASERFDVRTLQTSGSEVPAWTRETVTTINRRYDDLRATFPELADLDQVVRLLSFFTWLRFAENAGHPVPDLDALLALDLPALPTDRTYQQVLAFIATPPPGQAGGVEVFERSVIADGLDRLRPPGGSPLPALRRYYRALAFLDRRRQDHAALARELQQYDPSTLAETQLDLLAYRAERLRMHQLVLSNATDEERSRLLARRDAGQRLRVFSVGIGGLDLGMSQAVARASRGGGKLSYDATLASGTRQAPAATQAPAARTGSRPRPPAKPTAREAWREDPGLLPETVLPPHGRAACGANASTCEFSGGRLTTAEDLTRVVTGTDGPNPTSRTLFFDSDRRVTAVERLDNRQWMRYRLQGSTERRVAVPLAPAPAAPTQRAVAEPTPGMIVIEITPSATANDPASLAGATPRLALTVRSSGRAPHVTEVSRPSLQRLVLGRFVDPSPGQPLPPLAPLPQGIGEVDSVVVMQREDRTKPPWDEGREPIPGEEDAARVAAALRAWWADDVRLKDVAVAVGTDPGRSPKRLSQATTPERKSVLILPEDGFFPPRTTLRDRLREAWGAGPVTSELPDKPTELVVLVSGEPPALLGERLRALSRDPRMKDKLLAVYSLSGPVRIDLPASLLAEGVLAGVGLAAASTVGSDRAVDDLATMARAIAGGVPTARRASDRFVWFY